MPTFIALLRGINVGTAKRVAMADLREIVEDLGYEEVRTVLNSGNVVFEGKATGAVRIAGNIEKALAKQLRIASKVIVVTADELRAVVKEDPLQRLAKDPSRHLVAFAANSTPLRKLASLGREEWKPEALSVGKRAAYLWCPDGMIKSAVAKAVAKTAGDAITMRNWTTVSKLRELV